MRTTHTFGFPSTHDYINRNFFSTTQTLIGMALISARAQRAPKSKVKRSGSANAQPPSESKVPPSGSAGAQPPPESKVPPSSRPKLSDPTETRKDMTNTLLLVSTLVATVTFAAGFTMPGGYNSSNPNAGMATLLMRNMFHVFVICNTIAMHTSILAVITLIWAHLHDTFLFNISIQWGLAFLGLAVIAMSLGFMASVYLAVSNLHWLAIVVLIIGIICLVGLLIPLHLLFLPDSSTNCIVRYISYYPFLILVWASSPKIKRKD